MSERMGYMGKFVKLPLHCYLTSWLGLLDAR